MTIDRVPARFGHHGNAFGFLRLVMATAVIAAHAPPFLYGGPQWDPFLRLFGTIALGDVAVGGFFAISGYLITASYLATPSIRTYLVKRFARIYPGFIVASLLSIFVVAPLGGTNLLALPAREWADTFVKTALLGMTSIESFHGTWRPGVNGSLWTIIYEFRCYLLLIPLGALGLLRRPWALAAIAVTLLLLTAFASAQLALLNRIPLHSIWFGDGESAARLFGIFLAGAAAYAFGDRIVYTIPRVAIAAVLLVSSFFVALLPALSLGLLGTYVVLGIAFLGRGTWMERVNNRDDISYGVYLYAWPITKLLVWYWPGIPLAVLLLLAFAGSLACGWASWHGLEKPVLEWVRGRTRRPDPAVAPRPVAVSAVASES